MTVRTVILSVLTALSIISCKNGTGLFSGGGDNDTDTAVSYGAVTGFASVAVNEAEYNVDSSSFIIDGVNGNQNDLAVGMIVTVTHDGDGDAQSIRYNDNVEGPIANLNTAGGTFDVLGVRVTVNDLTNFDAISDVNDDGLIDINDLANLNIVEVSGYLTADNTVLATRLERKGACPLASGVEIEVKGTITDLGFRAFTIGSLTVNDTNGVAPSGLQNGDYVEVKSDDCPVTDTITATSIKLATEGPDLSDLDKGDDALEIRGPIANFVDSPCAFVVNGQRVSAADNLCLGLVNGDLVEAEGNLDSHDDGTLVATRISSEEEDANPTEYTAIVAVESQTDDSPFIGRISLQGVSGTFTTDLNTRFEGESQPFNLDTMTSISTCAEVKVDSADVVLGIEEKNLDDCP